MPRWPKRDSIFAKPPHPRSNWKSFNEMKHERALAKAIDLSQKAAEARTIPPVEGLRASWASRPRNRFRFERLSPAQRLDAEVELQRLINRHVERTGHLPSPQKLKSLIANATWIILYCRTGKRKAWVNRAMVLRRVLDSKDRQASRSGTPAEPPSKPKRRSSWKGLAGI